MDNPENYKFIANVISFILVLIFYFFGKNKNQKVKDSEEEILSQTQTLLKEESSFSSMMNRDFQIKYIFDKQNRKGKKGEITALWGRFKFPLDLYLMISPSGIWGRLLRMFGIRGAETGDAEFDKHFFIKSNRSDFVSLIFQPEIRDQIKHWPSFQYFAIGSKKIFFPEHKSEKNPFDDQQICWCLKVYGIVHDPLNLKRLAEKAFVLADSIEKYAPPAMEVDRKAKQFDFFRYGTPNQVFIYYIGLPAIVLIGLIYIFYPLL